MGSDSAYNNTLVNPSVKQFTVYLERVSKNFIIAPSNRESADKTHVKNLCLHRLDYRLDQQIGGGQPSLLHVSF